MDTHLCASTTNKRRKERNQGVCAYRRGKSSDDAFLPPAAFMTARDSDKQPGAGGKKKRKKVKSLHAQLNGGVNSSREKLDSTDRSSAGFRGCQREQRRGPRKGELDYLKLQLCSRAALPPSITSEGPSVLAERKREREKEKKTFIMKTKCSLGVFLTTEVQSGLSRR